MQVPGAAWSVGAVVVSVALTAVPTSAKTLYWLPNSNWDRESNWINDDDVVCAEGDSLCPEFDGGDMQFPGPVVLRSKDNSASLCENWGALQGVTTKIPNDIKVGSTGLQLAKNTKLYLGTGAELMFDARGDMGGDPVQWRCKDDQEMDYSCGHNWGTSFDETDPSYTVPCSEDTVVFPDDSAAFATNVPNTYVSTILLHSVVPGEDTPTSSFGKIMISDTESSFEFAEFMKGQFQGHPIGVGSAGCGGSVACKAFCENTCVKPAATTGNTGFKSLEELCEEDSSFCEAYDRESELIAEVRVRSAENAKKFAEDAAWEEGRDGWGPGPESVLPAWKDVVGNQMPLGEMQQLSEVQSLVADWEARYADYLIDDMGFEITCGGASCAGVWASTFSQIMQLAETSMTQNAAFDATLRDISVSVVNGGLKVNGLTELTAPVTVARDVARRVLTTIDSAFDYSSPDCHDDGTAMEVRRCFAMGVVDKAAATYTLFDGKDYGREMLGSMTFKKFTYSYADADFQSSIFASGMWLSGKGSMNAAQALAAQAPSTMADCQAMVEALDNVERDVQNSFIDTVNNYIMHTTTVNAQIDDYPSGCAPLHLGRRARRAQGAYDLAAFEVEMEIRDVSSAMDTDFQLLKSAVATGTYLAETVFLKVTEAEMMADDFFTVTTTTTTTMTEAPGHTDDELKALAATEKTALETAYGTDSEACRAQITELTNKLSENSAAVGVAKAALSKAILEKDAACNKPGLAANVRNPQVKADYQLCQVKKTAVTTAFAELDTATDAKLATQLKLDYLSGVGYALKFEGRNYIGVCPSAAAVTEASTEDEGVVPDAVFGLAVVVLAVVLITLCIVVVCACCRKEKKGDSAKQAAHTNVAFENPMYDDPNIAK